MAKPKAVNTRHTTNFDVFMDGKKLEGVISVQLPEREQEVQEHRAGNNDKHTQHVTTGKTAWTPLVIETTDPKTIKKLKDNMKQVRDGKIEKAKKPWAVQPKTKDGKPDRRYEYENGFVQKEKPGELHSKADGEQAVHGHQFSIPIEDGKFKQM